MKEIRIDLAALPCFAELGRQGENNAVRLVFDCSSFAESEGEGRAVLLHKRSGDEIPYIAEITQNESTVIWSITSADTEHSGAGRAQLCWYVGDVLAKTAVFLTEVYPSLTDGEELSGETKSALDIIAQTLSREGHLPADTGRTPLDLSDENDENYTEDGYDISNLADGAYEITVAGTITNGAGESLELSLGALMVIENGTAAIITGSGNYFFSITDENWYDRFCVTTFDIDTPVVSVENTNVSVIRQLGDGLYKFISVITYRNAANGTDYPVTGFVEIKNGVHYCYSINMRFGGTLSKSGNKISSSDAGPIYEAAKEEAAEKQNCFEGKIVSVLGDSISTFSGYIPVSDVHSLTHRARYPQSGLLTDVNDTYWKKLIDNLGAKLGVNDSWAGTRVSNSSSKNTGDVGPDACMASVTRISNLGANGTPDIILFYGGTNDAGAGVTPGTFNSTSNYTSVDLTTKVWSDFASAYRDAIMRLQYYYPDAKIVVLLPTYTENYYTLGNLDKYNEIIKDICDYFGVTWFDLRACGINWQNKDYTLGDGIHPTAEGMDLIERYLRSRLISTFELPAGENTVYSVTNSLSNVTNGSAYIKGVSKGRAYTATLTANEGYALGTVRVTMGGSNITSAVYSNGNINIPSVTGNIVITATATSVPTYTVTNNLSNVTTNNSASRAAQGSAYNATLTAAQEYEISSVTVKMGGVDITSTAYSNGTISIASVTGNIIITATGAAIQANEEWYHTAGTAQQTGAVNLAGRGWCYRDNVNDSFIGVPINAIRFWTNTAVTNGDVSISIVDKNTSEPVNTTSATYNKADSGEEQITVIFPDTLTLQEGQYLAFFAQTSTNFNALYNTAGGLTQGFYSRVPKVYGSGTAWTEANQNELLFDVGYITYE